MIRRAAQRGFTLLEMSVVIAIISVVVAMGIDMGQSALTAADRVAVRERVALAKRALEHYATTNGYLPCPASFGNLPGDGNFGFERRLAPGTGCNTSGLISTNGVFIGMLPFRTLNLPDSYASDPWNNKITYAVSAPHTGTINAGIAAYHDYDGAITIRTGPRTGTNYIITTARDGTVGPGATFVVLSHGPDGVGAYPLNGTAPAISCSDATLTDVENCDHANNVFYDNAYNDGEQAATHFDDYIAWGSNITMRDPVSSSAAIGPGSCTSNCEPWCAPCTLNIGSESQRFLCSKVIVATSPSCQAACLWAGGGTPCP
jgi:prepilin-type N-terminal cleavage/methylation domain-containing protein